MHALVLGYASSPTSVPAQTASSAPLGARGIARLGFAGLSRIRTGSGWGPAGPGRRDARTVGINRDVSGEQATHGATRSAHAQHPTQSEARVGQEICAQRSPTVDVANGCLQVSLALQHGGRWFRTDLLRPPTAEPPTASISNEFL